MIKVLIKWCLAPQSEVPLADQPLCFSDEPDSSKLSITKILFRLFQTWLSQVRSLSRPVSRQTLSDIPNKNFSFLNFLTRGHRPDQYFLGDENLWRVFIEQKNMGHRAQQTKRCPLSQHSFSRPGSLSRIFHRHLLKGCQDSFVCVLYVYTLYTQHKTFWP